MILTPDNEYSAVLDACVLAPMPLCDTLLRCAEEPALFRVLWSQETLNEVARTIAKFGYSEIQAKNRVQKMREAFPEAEVFFPEDLLKAASTLPDPRDQHVLAAAIHARANVIVTANLKDFPQNLLKPYNITVSSPDDFLIDQYHLNIERLLDVIDTQAAGISRQRQDVLQRLRPGLPKFVALVEAQS